MRRICMLCMYVSKAEQKHNRCRGSPKDLLGYCCVLVIFLLVIINTNQKIIISDYIKEEERVFEMTKDKEMKELAEEELQNIKERKNEIMKEIEKITAIEEEEKFP